MADRVQLVGPPLGLVTRQAADAQAKVTGGASNYATQSALQVEKNGEDSRFARAARWAKPRATELIAGLARIQDMRKEADREKELARKDPWQRPRKSRKPGDKAPGPGEPDMFEQSASEGDPEKSNDEGPADEQSSQEQLHETDGPKS